MTNDKTDSVRLESREKKKWVAAIGSAMWVLSVPAYAEDYGLTIQVEPLYMDVFGNDQKDGDINTTTFSRDPDTFEISRSTSSDPIDLDMDTGVTFRGEIQYLQNQWGVGASGWFFSADDSFSGNFSSGPGQETFSPVPQVGGPSVPNPQVTVVSVNEELIAPSVDNETASPLRFRADNELDVWTADIYGFRSLAESPHSRLGMTFGVKLGNIDNERSEFGEIESSDIAFDASARSLRHSGELDSDVMAGPSIGLQGDARLGRHHFEGLLTQSLLIGEVDHKSEFRDEFLAFEGVEIVVPSFLIAILESRMETESFHKSETVAIPITEFQLKYLYSVTDHLSVGGGVFGSIWVDAPVAPVRTELKEETLVFFGGMLSASYRF